MPNRITADCQGCQLCVKYCPVGAIQGLHRQVHFINPGQCIECQACGRACAFSAVLDRYDEVIQHIKISEWPKPIFSYHLCVSCNICLYTCPVGAISKMRGGENADQPRLPFLKDAHGCVSCGFCVTHCPTGAIQWISKGD